MARNDERSMNADLREGMTDGSYHKEYVNWGGAGTFAANRSVSEAQRASAYDAHMTLPEAKRKIAGDGTPA